MTAKEKLRERVETLTEQQAAEELLLRDQRSDPLMVLLDNAPLDDEPVTEEEEAAVQIAREEIARRGDDQSRGAPRRARRRVAVNDPGQPPTELVYTGSW